jgi:hypothetical protein
MFAVFISGKSGLIWRGVTLSSGGSVTFMVSTVISAIPYIKEVPVIVFNVRKFHLDPKARRFASNGKIPADI